jgi:hypothetical protein
LPIIYVVLLFGAIKPQWRRSIGILALLPEYGCADTQELTGDIVGHYNVKHMKNMQENLSNGAISLN